LAADCAEESQCDYFAIRSEKRENPHYRVHKKENINGGKDKDKRKSKPLQGVRRRKKSKENRGRMKKKRPAIGSFNAEDETHNIPKEVVGEGTTSTQLHLHNWPPRNVKDMNVIMS